MAHELIKVLKDIHRELIVANMETPRLKEMQREVFKLEDQYKVFEKRSDYLEMEVNRWIQENCKPEDDIDAMLKEQAPTMLKAQENTDNKLSKIYEELETYKGYGLVTEYE
jgi:hypothetical protein